MTAERETERGPDRRQAPRRVDDAHLHYTRELLCAAALAVVDLPSGWANRIDQGALPHASSVQAFTDLLDAAEQYRQAVANTEGAR